MKLFLIDLLKEHDVPGFRTHNAWSKDAWTNIVRRMNAKFGTSYTVNQVKQQEQDLKKAYRSVKDLLAESGFGWDTERMMVTAPASVWSSFTARNNNKDAFHWQDRSFPYYDALSSLYDGEAYISCTFLFACLFDFLNLVIIFFCCTSFCRSSCRRENPSRHGPLCKQSKECVSSINTNNTSG